MQDLMLSDRELDELFVTSATITKPAPGTSSMRIDLSVMHPTSPYSSAPSSPAFSPRSSDIIPLADGAMPKRCGYRTGKCPNLQAVKRNGKLHKLCEFHREKANLNQKKLDRKKRMQRFSPYEPQASSDDECHPCSPAAYETSPRSIAAFSPHPTRLDEAPLALGGEELEIFYSLMMVDLGMVAATPSPPLRPSQAIYEGPYMRVV